MLINSESFIVFRQTHIDIYYFVGLERYTVELTIVCRVTHRTSQQSLLITVSFFLTFTSNVSINLFVREIFPILQHF